MEEDSPCPARVLCTRQLVSSSRQCTGSPDSAVKELLAQKQVCMLHPPPYSPDLSPCDYFLFPKLKLPLKRRLFEDVTSSLRAIPQEDVQRSFQSLDRATRCIDAEGMSFIH